MLIISLFFLLIKGIKLNRKYKRMFKLIYKISKQNSETEKIEYVDKKRNI